MFHFSDFTSRPGEGEEYIRGGSVKGRKMVGGGRVKGRERRW